MALHPGDGLIRPFGIGILSRIPILRSESIPYAGLGSGRELVDLSSADSKVRTSRYFVVLATVALADARFTIGNTHFPWTPDGSASDDQREACDRLIGLLGERPVVLCGDFNAPRGARSSRGWPHIGATTSRRDIPAASILTYTAPARSR